MSVGI